MGEPTFGVLGPLRVRVDGVPVHLGGPKPRAILATLLLQPGAFVSLDLLTEVLWPGGAPRSAVANVRTYVRALRRALSEAGPGTEELRTRPSGYTLDIPSEDLDLLLFERRLDEARGARDRGDHTAALRGYESALALWRGGVLQDVPDSVLWQPTVVRLEQARSAAVDECLEVRLHTGDYPQLVAELRARLSEDGLREDLWQMLVRALHSSGRTLEAKAAYSEAERVLAAELGIEPGPSLRGTGEDVHGYVQRRRAAALEPVCQLPMDVPDFTGRDEEVDGLQRLLSAADRQPVVGVLSGPPGSGKSTLALHVAHMVRDAFPDGQLHVDLGGMSDQPREPTDVLGELLRGLGVIDGAIPAEAAEQTALFRSRLAQRRFLILLDDAADSAQVRALLPGTGGSAVLVSSRRRMPDLPGQHVPVDVMRRDEARALLGTIIGPDRIRLDEAATDRVLACCGCLPLAVRIAGARLTNRPGWTVNTLADFLQNERGRLDQLQTGDMEVRASAELSYRHLSEGAAEVFRAFGKLAQEAVGAWLIAVATGRTTEVTGELATLVDEHLVEVVGTDRTGTQRFRMHNLLRCYAQELADTDPPDLRRDHQLRVIDSLITLARTANTAMPSRFLGLLGEPCAATGPATTIEPAVRAQPVEWFETERRILVAAVEAALRHGEVVRAADLAIELAGFFDMRGYYGDWLRTHQPVYEALPSAPNVQAAALLRNLGQLHLYQDRYPEALGAFKAAHGMFARLGYVLGGALAAVGAGSVHRVRGDLDAALDAFEEALHGFGKVGDRHGEAVAHNAIASVWLERGDAASAAPWLDGALALSTEVGDLHRTAQVRRRLAVLYELRGDPGSARAELDRALGIFDELADAHCAAYVQQSVGELCLRQGDAGQASALLVDALAVQQQLGDRRAEARLACLLGELHHARGRDRSARHYFHRSLSAWRRLDAGDQAELVDTKLRSLT